MTGAERRAHRHLLLPRDRADQQQVGDVDARDQQHDARRAEQNPQRLAWAQREDVLQRHHQEPVIVIAYSRDSSAARSAIMGSACCRRDAWLQTTDDHQEVAAAGLRVDGSRASGTHASVRHISV